MKRKIVSILCSLAVAFSLSVSASAANTELNSLYTAIEGTAGAGNITIGNEIQVAVNSVKVEFPDAKPFADENNRTLIPVRFVTEAMGAQVNWDQETQTAAISKNDTLVEITIGRKDIRVTNDAVTETVMMDTVAVAKDGRTFVPIRFVAEALGAFVDYSDLYKLVDIAMPDEVTADEIKRLRSYEMVKYRTLVESSPYWEREYDQFVGNYWFANSHYFLVTLDKPLGFDVKNLYTRMKAPEGTNALDYARFAVQCAEDELETSSFPSATGKFDIPGRWSTVDIQFRTDDSLIYQCCCKAQSVLSIRGIIEVTADTARGVEVLAERYGVGNPKIGITYSIDGELVLAVGSYNYLDYMVLYRFDSDGQPIEIPCK